MDSMHRLVRHPPHRDIWPQAWCICAQAAHMHENRRGGGCSPVHLLEVAVGVCRVPGVVELDDDPGGDGPVDGGKILLQPCVLGAVILVVGPPAGSSSLNQISIHGQVHGWKLRPAPIS